MSDDAPGPDPDPNPSGHLDPEWLEEQYWDEKRSAPDIADECGVSYQVVYRAMDRFGIPRRTRSEALYVRHRVNNPRTKYADTETDTDTNDNNGTED